jgi:hypothetical protein
MSLDPRWTKIDDDCYRLKEEYCFPGTAVYVDRTGYKQWRVRLVNLERFQSEERSWEKGSWCIVSRKSWTTPYATRVKALGIRFDHTWLGKVGIDVHDEKYKEVRLKP